MGERRGGGGGEGVNLTPPFDIMLVDRVFDVVVIVEDKGGCDDENDDGCGEVVMVDGVRLVWFGSKSSRCGDWN